MTAPRWQRIEALMAEARDQPAAARDAFLARACGDDDALRAEVASLLEADARAGHFLAEPTPAAAPHVGERIGPYRVLRLIGQGGMSDVFLAEREDGAFRQQVALKTIRAGTYDPEMGRRFKVERQILAALDHPGIARLLDGGTTEAGVPYVVMTYIEGTPIDEHCDAARLSLDDRLRLFVQVCDAVSYAHRNLVVHRDLKPGNILITPEGRPMLLDFGIAKLLAPERFPDTVVETRTGRRPMTPVYASPEQIAGGAITTATDVYGLGVLLFELLVGCSPYRPETEGALGIEQAIRSQPPVRPAVALRGAAADERAHARRLRRHELRRRLRGDLETILGKVLRKKPERRYGSVAELADDVRRHLGGHPVRARPPALGYRLGKWIGRHRLASVAFGILIAAGVVFTWNSVRQHRQVARERDAAHQIAGFLQDIFLEAEPGTAQGDDPTASVLLERGERRIASLDGQPDVQASLMTIIGRVYRGLGTYERAEPLLMRALAQRRAVGAPLPVAETATTLAQVHAQTGDLAAARRLHEEALALRRATVGDGHPLVAQSRAALAMVHLREGDHEAAIMLSEAALAAFRRLHGDDHPDVLQTLSDLAAALHQGGRRAEAELRLRALAPLQRAQLGDRHPDLARTLNNLGVLLRQGGDHAAAEAHLREALAIRRHVLGDTHPDAVASMGNLAAVLRFRDQDAEAETLLRAVLERRRTIYGDRHPAVANALHNLADLLQDGGDGAAAEPLFRQAVAVMEATVGLDHPSAAYSLIELGSLVCVRDDGEGEAFLRRAVDTRRQRLGPRHWLTAWAENALGACRLARDGQREAASLLQSSTPIILSATEADARQKALARQRLALLAPDPSALVDGERNESPIR